MSGASSSDTNLVSIKVEISAMGGMRKVNLSNIPLSMTIGELKSRLNVRPNSRFGRSNKYENWDNRRTLSDYFVKNEEQFMCVIQCMVEDGQSDVDDYDQWLLANQKK